MRPGAKISWAAMAVAASLTACGGGGAIAARRPADVGPTTAPAALPGPVRLADAKPLAELTPGEVTANLTDKLEPPQVADGPVYFGEVDEYDGPGEDANLRSSLPVLAARQGDAWRAVAVVGPGLADTGWRYVGAGPARGEVWGVLDTAVGAGGPTFVLAHSTDAAATFALATLRKPCRQASVFDFAMNRDGRGRVTLTLDEAVGRDKPGLYHYETADGGRTWSTRPRFEPDGMTRADNVPDAEQPDPADDGGKTNKTAWRPRRPRTPVVTVRCPAAPPGVRR